MQRRRGGDKKRGNRWSCLHVTFVCVMWCWIVLLYFYWRNIKVRKVMDEFVDAEKSMFQEDMRIVANRFDHDVMPKIKVLEKMKLVATLPDLSADPAVVRTPAERKELVQKDIERMKGLMIASGKAEGRPPYDESRSIEHDIGVKEKMKQVPLQPVQQRTETHTIESEAADKQPEVHVAFSTDCSPFQDWQTLLVFHSAHSVGQRGHITRIASGCPEEKKSELLALYTKLWPNNYVHFTPDFKKDAKTKKKYDFYNKPYGVQHWLEHAEPSIQSGVIVALIDPDFVFLRPLTAKVKGNSNNIVSKPVERKDIFEYVSKGHPVAQQYGLGAPWVYDSNPEFNRKKICGPESPCAKVPDHKTGSRYWSVGPPYILERDDLHRLTQTWTRFVPMVYEGYPQLLAEM